MRVPIRSRACSLPVPVLLGQLQAEDGTAAVGIPGGKVAVLGASEGPSALRLWSRRRIALSTSGTHVHLFLAGTARMNLAKVSFWTFAGCMP